MYNYLRVKVCDGSKPCQHSQTSRAKSPLNPFYTWCKILLTGLHHSPVGSIPLLLPTNSSIFPLHLPPLLISLMCTRVRGSYHHHVYNYLRVKIRDVLRLLMYIISIYLHLRIFYFVIREGGCLKF